MTTESHFYEDWMTGKMKHANENDLTNPWLFLPAPSEGQVGWDVYAGRSPNPLIGDSTVLFDQDAQEARLPFEEPRLSPECHCPATTVFVGGVVMGAAFLGALFLGVEWLVQRILS